MNLLKHTKHKPPVRSFLIQCEMANLLAADRVGTGRGYYQPSSLNTLKFSMEGNIYGAQLTILMAPLWSIQRLYPKRDYQTYQNASRPIIFVIVACTFHAGRRSRKRFAKAGDAALLHALVPVKSPASAGRTRCWRATSSSVNIWGEVLKRTIPNDILLTLALHNCLSFLTIALLVASG